MRYTTVWMKYANSKKPDTKAHLVHESMYEISRRGKSIETESRLTVARGWGQGLNPAAAVSDLYFS